MINKNQWSTADFDTVSWHDNHVHGFKLIDYKPDCGASDIVFDIDHILEWIKVDGHLNFVIAQASLRFHEVTDLRLSIDYKVASAGMSPFSLSGIERQEVVYPTGSQSFQWNIGINWPTGKIEFRAPRFTQVLVGPSYTQAGQSLDAALRL